MDRAAIFSDILRRNSLRTDAGLPLLDVHAEFRRVVQVAWAREVHQRYGLRVRAELLARQRAKHGDNWGQSWGGRLWLTVMTNVVLAERYGSGPPS